MHDLRLELSRNCIACNFQLERVHRHAPTPNHVSYLRHEPFVYAKKVVRVVRASLEQLQDVPRGNGRDVLVKREHDVSFRGLKNHALI
jgi:hypothetical protein